MEVYLMKAGTILTWCDNATSEATKAQYELDTGKSISSEDWEQIQNFFSTIKQMVINGKKDAVEKALEKMKIEMYEECI